MRRILLAALLLAVALPAVLAAAQEPAPAIAIALEPLGDSAEGVVTRVSFRFAEAAEAGPGVNVFLQGSLIHGGIVIRNFRYAVAPDRAVVTTIQTFPEGDAEVEARLILPLDDGAVAILAKAAETFAIAKTNRLYIASEDDGAEGAFAEGVVPESVGAVKIRPPRRDVAPNLFIVEVDVLPPVQRVEFWVEGKRIVARNAPPYTAEFDLGKLPKRVEVRAVGFDSKGRYVDADAFIVNERETQLEVKITRVVTPDGIAHFKLSVQNPKNTRLKSVALFAGDTKLHEWTRPPYALDLPVSRLAGHQFVRASAIDDTGYEAGDLLFLSGDRYIEELQVHLIELPVSVSDAGGAAVTGLEQKNFSVFEDGKPQKLVAFNYAANLPISVGVLLDHSGSMERRMDEATAAAIGFFRNIIAKNDRAFIAGFASDPARIAPFVSDVATLEAQVNALPKAGGGTALYDAIVTGLYRFRNVQGRKALVVITDGDDTSSRIGYDDMLAYARGARVPLYFIGIGIGFGGGGRMRALAGESGGTAYLIRNVEQLPATYKQLENDLRSQYLLAYQTESTKNDQAYRAVEVKVDRPDAKVRTIRGFIP